MKEGKKDCRTKERTNERWIRWQRERKREKDYLDIRRERNGQRKDSLHDRKKVRKD